ncbi:hypothetical protein ACS5PK_06800 [Roseateles sp. DB2]|uniref:hypothetical protein n=1 Tax=Roseateles sp. DB2 TaxID=3453717 RepID=UPI003EE86982
MSPKTLSLLISAVCTLAGLASGLAPARADAESVVVSMKASTPATGYAAAAFSSIQRRPAQG